MTTDDIVPTRSTTRGKTLWASTRPYRPVLLLLVLLYVAFALTQPSFATASNLQNLLTAISILWIVSMGMTLVLLTGGADLSVAPVGTLSGIMLGTLVGASVPWWLALIVCLAAGALLGALTNGLLIGKLGLSFFVVTLATMTAFTGVVNLWANNRSVPVNSPEILGLAVSRWWGLAGPIWIMIILFIVTFYLQRFTYFGRDIYAVGGSPVAAKLSGIRVPRTLIYVYAFSGLCAAIGGVVSVSRIGIASAQVDASLPLQAIAAVLLGGTALTGGYGGVIGTAFGVLFIGVLSNGLSIAGVQSFWQQVATGLILLLAVVSDKFGTKRRFRVRRGKSQPPQDSSAKYDDVVNDSKRTRQSIESTPE